MPQSTLDRNSLALIRISLMQDVHQQIVHYIQFVIEVHGPLEAQDGGSGLDSEDELRMSSKLFLEKNQKETSVFARSGTL